MTDTDPLRKGHAQTQGPPLSVYFRQSVLLSLRLLSPSYPLLPSPFHCCSLLLSNSPFTSFASLSHLLTIFHCLLHVSSFMLLLNGTPILFGEEWVQLKILHFPDSFEVQANEM